MVKPKPLCYIHEDRKLKNQDKTENGKKSKSHMANQTTNNRTILTLHMKKDKSYTNNYSNNYTNSYPNKLNEIQLQIIEIIKENPTITAKEISMMIGNRGLPAIKWNLKQLKDNGIIERKGTTRIGQWIILQILSTTSIKLIYIIIDEYDQLLIDSKTQEEIQASPKLRSYTAVAIKDELIMEEIQNKHKNFKIQCTQY